MLLFQSGEIKVLTKRLRVNGKRTCLNIPQVIDGALLS
jgi:hypothetical protein